MEFDIRSLWRQKWTLVISTLAGMAVAFVYLQYATPSYQAMARVLVEPQAPLLTSEPSGRVDPEFLPTQAETIRSPVTIRQVLKSVSVTPPPGADLEKFDPIRHVLKELSVTPVLKANVLTIAYRSTDPEEAVDLISTLIKSYEAHVAQLDHGDYQSQLEVVQSREAVLREDLERAKREYDTLRRDSPMIGKGREADQQALQSLRQLSDELGMMRQQRVDLETKLTTLADFGAAAGDEDSADGATTRSIDKVFPDLVRFSEPDDARTLQQLRDDLTVAEGERRDMDALYGPKHPDMILAEGRVRELEQLLSQRLRTILGGWERQLAVAQEAERKLLDAYQAEQQRVKASEDFRVREEHLVGEVTKLERLHATALEQLVNLQSTGQAVAEGRHSIDVLVIDGPAIIDDMTWPKPKLLLATCAALGLAIGLCVVVLQEFLRGSRLRPELRHLVDQSQFGPARERRSAPTRVPVEPTFAHGGGTASEDVAELRPTALVGNEITAASQRSAEVE